MNDKVKTAPDLEEQKRIAAQLGVNVVSLPAAPAGHSHNYSIERDESPADANVRRFKEVSLYIVALVAVCFLMLACAHVAFDFTFFGMFDKLPVAPNTPPPATTPEDRKWAMSILTAGIGGLIGYLVKK